MTLSTLQTASQSSKALTRTRPVLQVNPSEQVKTDLKSLSVPRAEATQVSAQVQKGARLRQAALGTQVQAQVNATLGAEASSQLKSQALMGEAAGKVTPTAAIPAKEMLAQLKNISAGLKEVGDLLKQLQGGTTPKTAATKAMEQAFNGLQTGARGSKVSQLQQTLNDAGFTSGPVDGIFGPLTQAGLQAYQKSRGRPADGSVSGLDAKELASLQQATATKAGNKALTGLDRVQGKQEQDKNPAVTAADLKRLAPRISQKRAQELAPALSRAMKDANITTPKRKAAFLAQIAHESGGFKYMEEIASGRGYEGRVNIGNTQPGDGRRFKGRGLIQLTGRDNYRRAGKALGIDLINNPDLAKRPEVAAKVAAWFWTSNGLNRLADQDNFRAITKKINGGYNGYQDRVRYLRRAQRLLS